MHAKFKSSRTFLFTLFLLFHHTNTADKCFITFGILGAIADGLSVPFLLYVGSRIFNDVGTSDDSATATTHLQSLQHKLNNNALYLLGIGCGAFFACMIEGYCWSMAAQRIAKRKIN